MISVDDGAYLLLSCIYFYYYCTDIDALLLYLLSNYSILELVFITGTRLFLMLLGLVWGYCYLSLLLRLPSELISLFNSDTSSHN